MLEVYEYLDPEFISTEKDIRVKCECLNCGKKLEFQAECDLFAKALDKIKMIEDSIAEIKAL